MNSPTVNEDQRLVHAESHHYLGYAEIQLRDEPSALRDLRESIRLDPSSGWTHELLGEIYHKRGRMKEAAQEMKAALKLDPTIEPARKVLMSIPENQRR